MAPHSSRVVITGASRGIGKAIAFSFAERGYKLALLARNKKELFQTVSEAKKKRAVYLRQLDVQASVHGSGPGKSKAKKKDEDVKDEDVLALCCDLSRASEVQSCAHEIIKIGGAPLVVVNNAGIVLREKIEHTDVENWNHVMNVNLRSVFLVCKAFLPAMLKKRRGRFVHIASISATLGTPLLSAYCASKWGMLGFHRSLSEELRGTGLQSICILPGSVDTEMLKGSGFKPQMKPEDVAKTVLFSAIDAPDAIHAACIEMFGP